MDATQVRETWEAVARGDLGPLETVLAPDAKWRAVEDGPWNCQSRADILVVMKRNVAQGLRGSIEEIIESGDRVIVAFRPERHDEGAWPLDNGIRYMVLTTRGGLLSEMKGCATRESALAYAGAS